MKADPSRGRPVADVRASLANIRHRMEALTAGVAVDLDAPINGDVALEPHVDAHHAWRVAVFLDCRRSRGVRDFEAPISEAAPADTPASLQNGLMASSHADRVPWDRGGAMTVAELISALKEHPGDARVIVDGYEGEYDNVIAVAGLTAGWPPRRMVARARHAWLAN